MPEIDLGYGESSVAFDYDDSQYTVLTPDSTTEIPLRDEQIGNALDSPIDSPPLDEIVSGNKEAFQQHPDYFFPAVKKGELAPDPKFNVANVMIRSFLNKKRKTAFIDVFHSMLNEDGTPMQELFLGDNLHMNAKGYAIWQKIIEPYLIH